MRPRYYSLAHLTAESDLHWFCRSDCWPLCPCDWLRSLVHSYSESLTFVRLRESKTSSLEVGRISFYVWLQKKEILFKGNLRRYSERAQDRDFFFFLTDKGRSEKDGALQSTAVRASDTTVPRDAWGPKQAAAAGSWVWSLASEGAIFFHSTVLGSGVEGANTAWHSGAKARTGR